MTSAILTVIQPPVLGAQESAGPHVEYRMTEPVELPALRPGDLYVEPHLSADPYDPNHLVAASMALLDANSTSGRRLVVFESRDGGMSWTAEQIAALDDLEPIDVWTGFAADGAVLVSAMVDAPQSGRGLVSNVLVLRRAEGSVEWSEPVAVPSGRGGGSFDHATITTDRSYSETHGYVYVCGHQNGPRLPGTNTRTAGLSCSRSDDGAMSFDDPVRFAATNSDLIMPSVPVFLEDGTLLMAFSFLAVHDLEGQQKVLPRKFVGAIRSNDGGQSYLPFSVIAVEEVVSWTDAAVDRTAGDFHDRVYVTWHQNGEQRPGVLLSYSPDGGRLWSEPEILSTGPDADYRSSNVEVDSNGVVGVMLTRRDPDVIGCFELLFRASADGGRSFAAPATVARQGTCGSGQDAGAPAELAESAVWRRWRNGGEYLGMATDSEGRFHVLWAQPTSDPIHFRLLTRRVEVIEP